MALEIGQVVSGIGILPIQRGASPGDTAPNETTYPLPGQQAPPLTGVGAKPLSGEALQTLQGVEDGEKPADDGPGGDLTAEEKAVVEKLKARDREVRAHEAAHAAAGGQFAGAPTYSYQQGPDGRRYAVGGEVSIDLSPGSTPEETARKADQIRAAALAPADPSGQDRAVAAAATQMKAQAQAEAATQRREELEAKQADEPAVPDAGTPEETPEIAGPKPPGSEAGGPAAETGGQDLRQAAAANAYSRTDEAVNRAGKAAATALSLVA